MYGRGMTDPTEHPEVQRLLAEPDPARRGALATELLTTFESLREEVSRIRLEAVDQLYAAGYKRPDIAEALRVTPGRVSQLRRSGPRPERVLLGISSPLTVALGGKQEADKSKPGPVVSQEDLIAYEYLSTAASDLGFSTQSETVHPPGHLNLNRPNLVVVCGPRLSPNVAQILDGDPHWGFDKDQHWYLREHHSGRTWHSPIDADPPTSGDYCYLARIPRPDQRGTVLYMAGIHAPGCAGAAHFFVNHLEELYQVAPPRMPWSMLVYCEFDQDRRITHSEPVTDLKGWRR